MKRSTSVASPSAKVSAAPATTETSEAEERVRIRAYQFCEDRGRARTGVRWKTGCRLKVKRH